MWFFFTLRAMLYNCFVFFYSTLNTVFELCMNSFLEEWFHIEPTKERRREREKRITYTSVGSSSSNKKDCVCVCVYLQSKTIRKLLFELMHKPCDAMGNHQPNHNNERNRTASSKNWITLWKRKYTHSLTHTYTMNSEAFLYLTESIYFSYN